MSSNINAAIISVSIGDEELIELVGQNNPNAFKELYDRYKTYLYTYLYRLTGEETISEELLQETFVAAWNGARRFRGSSQVKTWLFRIAHNQAVSWLRKKKSQVSIEYVEMQDGQKNPEMQAMDALDRETVRSALGKLSPEHRAVIELAFFFEMNYDEIAEIMNCPLGTVKSRMSYARQRLSGIIQSMNTLNDRPVDQDD